MHRFHFSILTKFSVLASFKLNFLSAKYTHNAINRIELNSIVALFTLKRCQSVLLWTRLYKCNCVLFCICRYVLNAKIAFVMRLVYFTISNAGGI